MRTFLERFYDYVHSPGGFDCVQFQYEGITYQVVSGTSLCYTDENGKKCRIILPDNIEQLLDAHVLKNGKTLREIWNSAGENDLFPDFY